MSDTCSTCRYWVPNDEPQGITSVHGWGECRRWPPKMEGTRNMLGKKFATFPITTGELGCGEHWVRPITTGYRMTTPHEPPR